MKFAIERSKFYLMDENGEEHELRLEKKALKEDPKEKQTFMTIQERQHDPYGILTTQSGGGRKAQFE